MSERTVIISVRGGVADIEQEVPGITVEIRDYDNCAAGSDEDRPDYCDEEPDDDPQCVCGVYRSEHALMGCSDGFQTAESWNRERDAIRDHIFSGGDYDDDGRPIFDHYHDYDESDDDGDMEHYAFDDAEDDEGDQ